MDGERERERERERDVREMRERERERDSGEGDCQHVTVVCLVVSSSPYSPLTLINLTLLVPLDQRPSSGRGVPVNWIKFHSQIAPKHISFQLVCLS